PIILHPAFTTLHPSFGSLAAHKPQQQQPLSVQAVSLFCEFSGGSEENPSGTGLKRKRRSVLASILISPLHPSFGSLAAHKPQQQQPLSVQAVSLFVNFLVDLKKTHSEVSHASDMPKRQECALTISSEHSDLAAASVIWFTCCSQAAAAAAAIRAGNSEVSHASDMPKRQECALTISSEHSDLAAASVIWFTCCSQAAAAAAAIRAGNSEVSHASDMPKRQECALTISSEHSDLAAASVIWFTCCSQAAAAAAAAIRAGNSEVSHASDMPKRQECALTISSEHSDLAAASVIWFTCCSQAAAAAAAAIRAGNSEVSHASDMPKRQECALTISSEHSDLAAASVIWFTCCSQAAAAAAAAIRAGSQSICEFSGGSEENPSGTGLKRKRRSVLASILISPLHPSFGSLAAHKPQQQQPLSVQAVSLFVNFLVDLKKTRPAQD
uniref:Secreted protein n=2 Tax=Macrostomum lignano TaxID=282301 RepID=A0A1I8JKW4_9PLAT